MQNVEKLREKIRLECQRRGLSRSTAKSYVGGATKYLAALNEGLAHDVQSYLDYRAEIGRSASTIHADINALHFLCVEVLGKPPFRITPPKASKGPRLREFLTQEQCLDLIERLPFPYDLQAALMFGTGMRVSECLSLRIKDLDFTKGVIGVRGGKGDKDRLVTMPESAREGLEKQIGRSLDTYKADQKRGVVAGVSDGLREKLGSRLVESFQWYWLFPSARVRRGKRWRSTRTGVAAAIKQAGSDATPHVFRHSYATAMLQSGVDLETLSKLLGHADIRTTAIYCHAQNPQQVASPLDGEAHNVIKLSAAKRRKIG